MATCSEDRLAAAEDALGVPMPHRIKELFRTEDGHHRDDGGWWVVWPLDRLVADNTSAWRDGTLPRAWLAIGDDGTGAPFCVPIDGHDEVVRWSWIDADVEAPVGALVDFLSEWVFDSP